MSLAEGLLRWRYLLASCLPDGLARLIAPRDRCLTLVLKADRALLCQDDGQERKILTELEGRDFAALGALIKGNREGEPRSRIELPTDWIVSRQLSLPSQARSNLRQVLGYEMDRLTPFNPDQIFYDFHLVGEGEKGDRLSLELVLCRREVVQPWLERMRAAGAPVDRLTWPGAWPSANLLPDALRPRRRGHLLGLNTFLSLLALVLISAVLITPIWQKTQLVAAQNKELGRLRGQAAEVNSLREAIESAHKGSIAVLERKSNQIAMIDLLRELTDRLPDGTWVENLEFQGTEVQIRGESTQSAALIGLLENAPDFSGVTFRSPVTQGRNDQGERFHIGFTVGKVAGGS